MPVYMADTNVYVNAANDRDFLLRFQAFIHGQSAPLSVSSVVVAEVLSGLPGSVHELAVNALTAGSEALAPSPRDWVVAATATRIAAAAEGKSRSLWNDALLAAQCARLGCVLITQNLRDFTRLQCEIPLEVAAPFPR